MRKLLLKKLSLLLALAVLMFVSGCASSSQTPNDGKLDQTDSKMVVAYFIQWGIYGRNYNVMDMPGDKLTHINYAFAECTPEFEIGLLDPWADIEKSFPEENKSLPYKGNFNQLSLFKDKYPHIKTLISLGGWTKSANFSNMAQTSEGRKKFAASCVDFLRKYPFDGIDIDWEYPGGGGMEGTDFDKENDRDNFVLLCKEIREQLDKAGKKDYKSYLLTAATGGGFEKIDHLNLPELAKYFNFINIMTYDFHVGSEPVSNHLAALYPRSDDITEDAQDICADAVIRRYIDEGFPASKINMGLPFYGRAWVVQSTENGGILQPAVEGESAPGTWEAGNYDYNDIAEKFVPEFGSNLDTEAKTAYVLDTDNNIFISYDSPESISIKCDYINEMGLGGAMFWDITGDKRHDLLNVISKKMDVVK